MNFDSVKDVGKVNSRNQKGIFYFILFSVSYRQAQLLFYVETTEKYVRISFTLNQDFVILITFTRVNFLLRTRSEYNIRAYVKANIMWYSSSYFADNPLLLEEFIKSMNTMF